MDPANHNLPGEILLSESFLSSAPGQETWQGPAPFSLLLTAGSYWLCFEVPATSIFFGTMKDNAVYPLADAEYAYSPGTGTYFSYLPNMGTGFRVYGDAAPVPVPGAVWLMGSGLVGLIGLRRKFSG